MPDSKETYMSPIHHVTANGSNYILLGSGGETIPGKLTVQHFFLLYHFYFIFYVRSQDWKESQTARKIKQNQTARKILIRRMSEINIVSLFYGPPASPPPHPELLVL